MARNVFTKFQLVNSYVSLFIAIFHLLLKSTQFNCIVGLMSSWY